MGFILSVARSVAMAFMTFSRIPMPHVEWEERSMRYLLAAFPLVGVVVALVCALWANLAAVLGFAPLVLAAGLVAIPLLVTGGIHLDGFCDVSDALSSHAEPERKCRIMKDPHVGAFSVMSVGLYLIVYVAVCSDLSLDVRSLACMCAIYPMERCLSGLLCLLNPKNSSDGMVSLFKKSA
ncbi:MAG: adenosylcobinamide-GDP ribazoletransferase, partial [Coriobacteriaceae bacterium]|nr:adenosylcobinamide-GDP ribazoletransferase [Coriobacteriaceae bacterium]